MASVFDNLEGIKGAVRRPRFGPITDVDGTISPTAPTPGEAVVSPRCRKYLALLSRRLVLVATVSGRMVADARRLVGIEDMVYIGNHGLGRWADGRTELVEGAESYPPVIRAVTEELGRRLTGEGILIENKGVTATVHFRLSSHPETARKEIVAALRSLPQVSGLRILPGQRAVNLLPPLAIDKGTATIDLIQKYKLGGGIYIGDEATDLDAFKAIHQADNDGDFTGFALAVLNRETPPVVAEEADFTLGGTDEVALFHEWLWGQVA